MTQTKLENCLEDALENIKNDRALALTLLSDLMQYIKVEEARHKEVGLTAAKYLETLQRSNEQLVKISALLYKKTNTSTALTDSDKEDLYSLIQGAEE
jgi:energy-converting hydrogenase A subunit M